MGIFDASTSASGNQSSSVNTAESSGSGFSNSWSRTYGTEASMISALQAAKANAQQEEWMNKEMIFNAAEAQKQRDFNELMGNTLYTRSVKNMMEAGINPILAYSNGLSGANVNSGTAASISAPSAFMGQTFADQASASHSEWSSHSHSSGSSQGSGWSNSESGLATALQNMGEFIGAGLSALSSAKFMDISLGDVNYGSGGKGSDLAKKVGDTVENGLYDIGRKLGMPFFSSTKSPQEIEKMGKEIEYNRKNGINVFKK